MEQKYHTLNIEKFYKAFQPNITTTKNGIIYFNSSDSDEDNAFPLKLQDSYRKSATHANFINLKSNLTYGSGLFSEVDSTELTTFLKKENKAGQNLDDIFQKSCFDIALYESACLQVVYNRNNQIAEVYHTLPSNVRAEEPDEYGMINNYYYSTNWGKIDNRKNNKKKANDLNEATIIPAFNPERGAKDGRQLLYIKRYSASNDIYTIPQYSSSFNFIELESVLSDYIVNKVSGGYYPSGIFYLNSNMSPEERDTFISDFRSKHEGSSNAGKIVFIFGDTNVAKPEFVKLTDDLGNSIVKDLITTSQLQISISHGGSMGLLGLAEGDTFGGSSESNKLNIARLYFIDSVIKNYQTILLKGINKILAVNALGKVTVNNDSLKLQQPLVDVNDLTVDERREIVYGLPPIAKI